MNLCNSNLNCQGVEVQLDQNHLAFGPVAQRCQATKRIVMTNTGDIGVRYVTHSRAKNTHTDTCTYTQIHNIVLLQCCITLFE